MMISVYALYSESENKIRYIGKTNNLKRRLYEHRSDARIGKSPSRKTNWIKANPNFKSIVMGRFSCKRRASLFEKSQIQKNRDTVLNYFDGSSHTEETKDWVVSSNTGRKMSESSKLKMSKSCTKYSIRSDCGFVGNIPEVSKRFNIPVSTLHYRIKSNSLKGFTVERH